MLAAKAKAVPDVRHGQCSACQLLLSLLPLLLLSYTAGCNATSSSLAQTHQKLLQ
jgi:hypothetical protein